MKEEAHFTVLITTYKYSVKNLHLVMQIDLKRHHLYLHIDEGYQRTLYFHDK